MTAVLVQSLIGVAYAAYAIFTFAELAEKRTSRISLLGISLPKPALLLPMLAVTAAYFANELLSRG